MKNFIRTLTFLYVVFFLFTVSTYGGSMEIQENDLKRHVMELSDRIGERNYVYYDSLEKAASYIAAEFNSYGYDTRFQTYEIGSRTFKNIIAEKKGTTAAEEIIIIGAHYDTVVGSPGANDNTTGVAALLELARLFYQKEVERTVKFIAFVNEEPPYFMSDEMGSRVYAKKARERGDDIVAMLSLETIGYYSDKRNSQRYPFPYGFFYPDQANFIGVVGNFHSRGLVKKVKESFMQNSDFNIESVVAPEFVMGADFSDHDSFWEYGYKACMITDSAFYRYPYYHSVADTYDKVVFDKFTEAVNGLYNVAVELSKQEAT